MMKNIDRKIIIKMGKQKCVCVYMVSLFMCINVNCIDIKPCHCVLYLTEQLTNLFYRKETASTAAATAAAAVLFHIDFFIFHATLQSKMDMLVVQFLN